MCFGWDVFRAAEIRSDVEQQTALLRLEIAPLRSRRRMCDGALALVREKSVRHGFAKRTVGLTPLGARGITGREVAGFELMILRRRAIQVVERRRLVVDRCGVNAHDASL